MARAADQGLAAAGYPSRSTRSGRQSPLTRVAGPQPIGDFLPRLQVRVHWIPVRIWRDGGWQVAWVVIRNLELVHVANNRAPRARRFAWSDHA